MLNGNFRAKPMRNPLLTNHTNCTDYSLISNLFSKQLQTSSDSSKQFKGSTWCHRMKRLLRLSTFTGIHIQPTMAGAYTLRINMQQNRLLLSQFKLTAKIQYHMYLSWFIHTYFLHQILLPYINTFVGAQHSNKGFIGPNGYL